MRLVGTICILACLAIAGGCQCCCCGKRASEEKCPTDVRKSHFWCFGEDAIFHYPCGPKEEFYGHEPTCWREWPVDGLTWSTGFCDTPVGPQPQFAGKPVNETAPPSAPSFVLRRPDQPAGLFSSPAKASPLKGAPMPAGLPVDEPSELRTSEFLDHGLKQPVVPALHEPSPLPSSPPLKQPELPVVNDQPAIILLPEVTPLESGGPTESLQSGPLLEDVIPTEELALPPSASGSNL